jgi:hypothetical protein
LNNVIFWDVTHCGSCKNRHFRGTYHVHHHILFLHSVLRSLVASNVVPSSSVLVTLMTGTIRSSETLVLTRATQPNIPEDGILHSHCHENCRLCPFGLNIQYVIHIRLQLDIWVMGMDRKKPSQYL